jgi:hypothetical protein
MITTYDVLSPEETPQPGKHTLFNICERDKLLEAHKPLPILVRQVSFVFQTPLGAANIVQIQVPGVKGARM